MNIRHFLQVITLAMTSVLPLTVLAQDYPSKPIKLLIPFTPGGAPTSCRAWWPMPCLKAPNGKWCRKIDQVLPAIWPLHKPPWLHRMATPS